MSGCMKNLHIPGIDSMGLYNLDNPYFSLKKIAIPYFSIVVSTIHVAHLFHR
jgi:hypothetical protein